MTEDLKPHQYRCSACKEVFDKGWSDEEARAELARDFQGVKPEDCDLICDECHKAAMAWLGAQPTASDAIH